LTSPHDRIASCRPKARQKIPTQLATGPHDLRCGNPAYYPVLDPDNYSESQSFGTKLRAADSNGVTYPIRLGVTLSLNGGISPSGNTSRL
jgi:hypothetical protein